jgi:hypothetical protein
MLCFTVEPLGGGSQTIQHLLSCFALAKQPTLNATNSEFTQQAGQIELAPQLTKISQLKKWRKDMNECSRCQISEVLFSNVSCRTATIAGLLPLAQAAKNALRQKFTLFVPHSVTFVTLRYRALHCSMNW